MGRDICVPIEIWTGETWIRNITYTDINGTPIDITGYSAIMMARETYNSTNPPVINASTSNGQIIVTGASGLIQINLGALITSALPAPFEGVWDVFIYGPANYPAIRLVGGSICIRESVTR